MLCPVCDNNVIKEKAFCPHCGWDLKINFSEISSQEKALYNERLKIVRNNWQTLQAYRRSEKDGGQEKIYSKILFCTDLYASSDYAFAAALDLTERSGAELIIFHVLESRHRYSGIIITDDGETWSSEEVFSKLRKKLREYYYSRIEKGTPVNVRIALRHGQPWIEILRFARKERVDLIVMGPYTIKDPGLGLDLEKPGLGDNAQKVSLQANCLVSIVSSPKQWLSLDGMKIKTT
jgi:nucleotide-binding universal stress UspA family protein